ncbi:MAG: hypothetical protein ACLR67_05465 [Eggerthella lenta]
MTGLRWESFRPARTPSGGRWPTSCSSPAEGGLLEDVEVVLDDGGRLFLGNRDAWPLAHAV